MANLLIHLSWLIFLLQGCLLEDSILLTMSYLAKSFTAVNLFLKEKVYNLLIDTIMINSMRPGHPQVFFHAYFKVSIAFLRHNSIVSKSTKLILEMINIVSADLEIFSREW